MKQKAMETYRVRDMATATEHLPSRPVPLRPPPAHRASDVPTEGLSTPFVGENLMLVLIDFSESA
jgi:hypothetical protein